MTSRMDAPDDLDRDGDDRRRAPRPRGLAARAAGRNRAPLEQERKTIEKKVAKERATATGPATRTNGMSLQCERVVGEDERLSGSVTSRDIPDQLKRASVE